jgi:uncharacterized protein (DUF488 family)
MDEQPAMSQGTIWTIGHSTRSSAEFLMLLQEHNIRRLIDIRRYAGSRRYPHFHSDALNKTLAEAGLGYRHMPELGGRRTPRPDSQNNGWKNAGFRGYADYMATDAFQRALRELMTDATAARTAIMCAEALPWRCHRSLVADALVTGGWEIVHIMGPGQVKRHQLTAFAVIQAGRLVYPAATDQDAPPRLF